MPEKRDNMQFLIGCEVNLPQWSLVIPNPTVLALTQEVAQYFPYVVADDRSLIPAHSAVQFRPR